MRMCSPIQTRREDHNQINGSEPLLNDLYSWNYSFRWLFREVLLFYPEITAPNIEEFKNFAGLRRSRHRMLQIFNDMHINCSAYELSSDPVSTVSHLTRPDF